MAAAVIFMPSLKLFNKSHFCTGDIWTVSRVPVFGDNKFPLKLLSYSTIGHKLYPDMKWLQRGLLCSTFDETNVCRVLQLSVRRRKRRGMRLVSKAAACSSQQELASQTRMQLIMVPSTTAAWAPNSHICAAAHPPYPVASGPLPAAKPPACRHAITKQPLCNGCAHVCKECMSSMQMLLVRCCCYEMQSIIY